MAIRPDSRMRLVLEGSGRNICVPTCDRSIEPAPRISRSPKWLLSPLYLKNPDGGKINVPWFAIARNFNRVLKLPKKDPRWTCSAWPIGDEFNLRSIVMVRLWLDDEWRYGWFVRFSDAPKELVLVPTCRVRAIMRRLARLKRGTTEFPQTWPYDYGQVFNAPRFETICATRFRVYFERLRQRLHKDREERRLVLATSLPTSSGEKRKLMEAEPAAEETCSVCLEECASSQSRCSTAGCGIKVCDVCHRDSRGFCPLCDRSALNAAYPCSACHELHPLSDFGFSCIHCDAHSLCRGCHTSYRQCTSCESRE